MRASISALGRLLAGLLLLLVPAAVAQAQALDPARAPMLPPLAAPAPGAEPGSELTVYLMTMGPGDAVWEKFGHNAIWIRDTTRGFDAAYNWGLFDFNDVDFIPRPITPGAANESTQNVTFTATDPFRTISAASSAGNFTVNQYASPSCLMSSIVAVPSTCPCTKWPPSLAPAASERSRLTDVPGVHPAIVVTRAVSGETSIRTSRPAALTTVRHTPAQAMEAPMAIRSGSHGQLIRTRKSPRCSMLSIVPIAVTMPVNMELLP